MNKLILNENVTMSSEKAQAENILAHLKKGRSITAIEALNLFGCLRLSARIYDLRKSGYCILSKTIKNNGKQYAQYVLVEEVA